MGIPILSRFLFQGILVEPKNQLSLIFFINVTSVLYMVFNIPGLYPILILGLQDLFSRYQVFHLTALILFAIIYVIHYIVFLLNNGIDFCNLI